MANILQVDVEETIDKFRDLMNTLSNFTHMGLKTFNVGGQDADHLAQQALDTFIMLFDTIQKCRAHSEMEEHAGGAVTDELVETTVQELDEIATHYQVCDVSHEVTTEARGKSMTKPSAKHGVGSMCRR